MTAILLVNLGSPASPSVQDVRAYLREFLSDRRVIQLSPWLWQPLLRLFVLRRRPQRTAAAYRRIWTADGSPLINISQAQRAALGRLFPHLPVALAMRYGEPSIKSQLAELLAAGVRRILLVPMYPQFSYTTTGTVQDELARCLKEQGAAVEVRCINDWHDRETYIGALRLSVKRYCDAHSRPERLLLSFHGLPQSYVAKGDPYQRQCENTARLLQSALPDLPIQLVYQSRFGREPWLQPYADETIAELGRQGCRHLAVMCPGFSADCLETLEEMAVENRQLFLENGGGRYGYIPALNAEADHIALLSELIGEHLWHNQ